MRTVALWLLLAPFFLVTWDVYRGVGGSGLDLSTGASAWHALFGNPEAALRDVQHTAPLLRGPFEALLVTPLALLACVPSALLFALSFLPRRRRPPTLI